MALLFPVVVAVLFSTIVPAQSSTSPFGAAEDMALGDSFAQDLTIPVTGKSTASFEAAFPAQKPGWPRFVAHVDDSAAPCGTYAFGYNYNVTSLVLLVANDTQQALAMPPLARAMRYFYEATTASAPRLTFRGYPIPAGDSAAVAGFVFVAYGPLLYVLGVVMLLPSFVIVMVRDQAPRRQLQLWGLRTAPYWLGNYAVDVMLFAALCAGVSTVPLWASGVPWTARGATFVAVLLLFSCSAPLLAYCVSHAFASEETAQRWAFPMLSLLYLLFNIPNVVVQAVLASSPGIVAAVGYATAALNSPVALARTLTLLASGQPVAPMLALLCGHAVMYAALLALIEWLRRRRRRRRRPSITMVAADADCAVDLDDVCVAFQSKSALDHVTFQVERGSIVAVLGPNGAGKSTLFSLLTGERHPDSGSVRVMGLAAGDGVGSEVCRRFGFLEQNDCPMDLTVLELLRCVAAIRGVDVAALDALLARVDLTHRADAALAQLSGGERRKVSVLAALMHRPRFLACDEPTGSIDIASRRQIHALLRELVDHDGATVWLSSHSMDEVTLLASRAIVLVHGSVRAAGTVRELQHRFGDGYHVQLDGVADTDAAVALFGDSNGGVTVELTAGARVHLTVARAPTVRVSRLFRICEAIQQREPRVRFTVSDATLGSAFVRIVENHE